MKVLFRAAFETARRVGFTTNIYNGEEFDNVAYEAYRGALTLRPFDGVENSTVLQYLHSYDNGAGTIFDGFNTGALTRSVSSVASVFAGAYGIDARGNVVPFAPGLTPYTAANLIASQSAQLVAQNARGPRAVDVTDPVFSDRRLTYLVNSTKIDLSDAIIRTIVYRKAMSIRFS
jgi:iron complex outermembrane recepter protein